MTSDSFTAAAAACWAAAFLFSVLAGCRIWRPSELLGYACLCLGVLCLACAFCAT